MKYGVAVLGSRDARWTPVARARSHYCSPPPPLPRARAHPPAGAMIRPHAQMLWGAPAVVPPRAFTEAPKARQPRQQLEAAFNAKLGAFMGRCSNLKLTPLEVRRDFEALLKARTDLVAATPPGMATQVAVAGPGKALVPGQLPAGQEPAQEAQVNWKGLLQQGMGKWIKRVMEKGDVEYAVAPADPTNSTAGYVATVICHCLEQQGSAEPPSFSGEEAKASKKLAEQEAARVATMQLFPDAAPAAPAPGGAHAQPGFAEMEPPSKKRKTGAVAAANPEMNADPKTLLIKGLQALKDSPLIKGDVVFTVEPTAEEGGIPMYLGTCAVICYDAGANLHYGEPKTSKKLAEFSASEVAYRALEPVLVKSMEEKKVLKAAVNAQKLLAFKEKQQAKKEAQDAAAILAGVPQPRPELGAPLM